MPPLPPASNVMKYTQSWILENNLKAESIMYFQYAGGTPSTSDCQAFASDIQASAVTNFKTHMSNQSQVGLGTVLDIGSTSGHEGQGGTSTAGTLSTLYNPASTCIVVNHQIARRYRGGKPRTYAPFGTANELQTQGTWTPTFVGQISTAWSNFITTALAATSSGITLSAYVNVSYYHAGALRSTPVVDPIVLSLGRQRIGTQRRRNKTA